MCYSSWQLYTLAEHTVRRAAKSHSSFMMPCSYGDYTMTPSGLQYFDLKQGTGPAPGPNSTCTVDWSGNTIGYYGERIQCACSRGISSMYKRIAAQAIERDRHTRLEDVQCERHVVTRSECSQAGPLKLGTRLDACWPADHKITGHGKLGSGLRQTLQPITCLGADKGRQLHRR